MEPFRVTCETCRSRLKIRSAEAIGQIHSCPKCGSMVHIAPPAGWSPDGATAAATPGASNEPAVTISTSASTIVPTDFDFTQFEEPTTASHSAPTAAPPTPLPIPTALAATVPVAGPPAPIELPDPGPLAGISPVVWFSLATAAVFVISGLTYILWPSHTDTTPTKPIAATAPTDQPATKPAEPTEQPPATADPYAADQTKQPADETKPADAPAESESEKPLPPPADNVADSQATTDAPPQTLAALAKPAEASPAKVDPPTEKVAAATPALPVERPDAPASTKSGGSDHVLKFDPLDFDPEHLSLSSKPSTTFAPSPPAPAAGSIPEAASDKAPIATVDASDKVPNPTDMLPPAANRAINVRRGPVAANDSQPADTAKHLATHVKSLQFTEMPLMRFVDTISDMAGAPITLDPITLELNGLSPRTAVSADATDATLESVLKTTLATQRLELAQQAGRVGIALPNATEQRAADFDVKDLAVGDDAAPVAKLLEQFVAPQTWAASKGKGTIEVKGTTLHLEQSLAARREALIFCERLRLARSLPQRSKYPAALLTLDSPYEKATAALASPTTFTFLSGTRLDDLVRQWQDMTGLTILVDWSALQDASLAPSSTLACSALDRPWAEALDGILEPLQLGWWAVDGQTIQITSLEALDRIERVEFYAVPQKLREQFATGPALVEALQKQIADRANKRGSSSEVRLALDEPSGRLIVRATPEVHRFLDRQLCADAEPLAKHQQ